MNELSWFYYLAECAYLGYFSLEDVENEIYNVVSSDYYSCCGGENTIEAQQGVERVVDDALCQFYTYWDDFLRLNGEYA